MAVAKKSFIKGFTVKVLGKDRSRLLTLCVGSRIPWSGTHERGGAIGGRILIPLHRHVGHKRFKAQVAELIRGGNTHFIKDTKGSIMPTAEDIKEHDRPPSGFKRRYRKIEGIRRLKRGVGVSIAVLVPRVQLRERLNVGRTATARIPRLSARIEKQLRLVG